MKFLRANAIPALRIAATACRSPLSYVAEADRLFFAQKYADAARMLRAYEMSTGHTADAEALLQLKIRNNPGDPC